MKLFSTSGAAEAMPARFMPLAVYNSERTRGLVHTAEWMEEMAVLQADFDAWAERTRPR